MDEASVASGRKKAMASDEGGSGGRMDGWVGGEVEDHTCTRVASDGHCVLGL